MNIFQEIRLVLLDVLADLTQAGSLPEGLDTSRIAVEPPRDAAHGDIAINAAMVLAKQAKMKPRDLAGMLQQGLSASDRIAEVEIAGPGFLNIRLTDRHWPDVLSAILTAGTAYGDSEIGAGAAVNVEFVSANPTGPMHVGHARGACVGDVLTSLLIKAGYAVTREYYINDAGSQVDMLARSLHARYAQASEIIDETEIQRRLETGEMQYGGDYLIPLATMMFENESDRWLYTEESDWLPYFREMAIDAMMDLIKADLAALGIHFDVFSSERRLVEAGRVATLLADFEARGLIYTGVLEPPKGKLPDDWEARPQTLFKATEYGDDVDRPLKKADGSYTYFANDIAYHQDKVERGFPTLINVWGADHGGYVKRMAAAVTALSGGKAVLDVKLCQLVNLLDNGETVRMSKRAGNFVTLREVVERVGKDAVRFMMLTRKNDATLDFDFTKVTEQSRDNPVFYVQYAHARCCSIIRHAKTADMLADQDLTPTGLADSAPLDRLSDDSEQAMIKVLAQWPRIVEAAAEAHEPHRLAYYLADVAAAFHGLWNRGNENTELRFLVPNDPETSLARLALVHGVRTVVASGLDVLGVQPVEEMR